MAHYTKSNLYVLYFDDNCPLCIKTVNLIRKFINPAGTKIKPLSKSSLPKSIKFKALEEMLLVENEQREYWGYYTYIKIISLTSYKFLKPIYYLISTIMKFPLISDIGKFIYKYISKRRLRCDDNCKLT